MGVEYVHVRLIVLGVLHNQNVFRYQFAAPLMTTVESAYLSVLVILGVSEKTHVL